MTLGVLFVNLPQTALCVDEISWLEVQNRMSIPFFVALSLKKTVDVNQTWKPFPDLPFQQWSHVRLFTIRSGNKTHSYGLVAARLSDL